MNCKIQFADPGERNLQVIRQLVDSFKAEAPAGEVALTADPHSDLVRFSFLAADERAGTIHGCPFSSLLVREPACAELLRGSLLEFLVHVKRRAPHLAMHAA